MRDNSQNEVIFSEIDLNQLIIAPPGFGKTETMARRIAFLICNKLISSRKKILGITFTNAAAFEMKKKVFQKIGKDQRSLLKILNFHSLCYEIISNFSYKLNLDINFDIISEIDSEKVLLRLIHAKLKEIAQDSDFSEKDLKNHLNKFNLWKAQNVLNSLNTFSPEDKKIYRDIFQKYSEQLLSNNKLDFDLLLIKTLELFKSHPKILSFIRRKISYIIIDEFQDTNGIQYSIAKKLIQGNQAHKSMDPHVIPFICFGDPYQSIYQFQGASSKNLDRLKQDFPEMKLKYLEINHRNKSPLIKTLNDLVRNRNFSEDFIFSGKKYECFITENSDIEAKFIVDEIKKLRRKGIQLHDMCLISPWYSRLNKVTLLLDKEKIDSINFDKFRSKGIEMEYKFLFKTLQNKINIEAINGNLINLFKRACNDESIDWTKDFVLTEIFDYFSDFQRFFFDKDMPFWKKIKLVLNDIRLYINWNQIIREKIQNKLFIASIHQVKGLEFNHVFLIGFEGGIIPNYMSKCNLCVNVELDLSEDINLLYVALSRMKDKCILTLTDTNDWGYRKYPSCILQDFIPIISFYDLNMKKQVQWNAIKCEKIDYQYIN